MGREMGRDTMGHGHLHNQYSCRWNREVITGWRDKCVKVEKRSNDLNHRPTMRKREVIPMFVWALLVNSASSYLVTDFARSRSGVDILTTIQGVSIETCKQECEKRERCTDAVYHRRSAYCVLTSASNHVQFTDPSVGAVHSYYKVCIKLSIRAPDKVSFFNFIMLFSSPNRLVETILTNWQT